MGHCASIEVQYGQNLGLAIDDYGSAFEFRNANRPNEINYLRWSLFEKGSEYFIPSKKDFMITYWVQNIEGLVSKLKDNGATLLDSISTYDYRKFIHLLIQKTTRLNFGSLVTGVTTK